MRYPRIRIGTRRRVREENTRKHALTLTVSLPVLCVFVDFFFAIFPWIFVWNLNMNRREKLIITISMSLGVM